MSLWFLDENEKPFAPEGGPTASAHPGAGAPPYQTQNSSNQPQGTYRGAQEYQQGPSPGQHQQGEAAAYFNPGVVPPQGPPPVSQDPGAYGAQSSPYAQSPPYDGQQPYGPGGMNQESRGFFDAFQQQQQQAPGSDQMERGLFSHNPLNPPPAAFQRPPPGHYTYIQFAPMSVYTNTERLQDGFQLIPPPARAGDQHPFASHDVTEEDWHKFLKDLEKTAHLSPTQRLGNFFKHNSQGVQERLKRDRIEPVGDYLLAWNQYFFQPRRMTVVLALGGQRYSGETEDAPPDLHSHHKSSGHSSHRRSDSGSSSDSDSDHRDSGGRGAVGLIGQRRARIQERREMRRDRRQGVTSSRFGEHHSSGDHHHHNHHHSHQEDQPQVFVSDTKFRLVVCFWDGSREVC